MDADDLRGVPLLEGLDESQLAELAARGTEVAVQPGTVVFREGEHAEHWWLLLDGAIELCRRVGNEDVQVAKMDVAGRWAGGFRAWDEQGVYLATGRGAVPSRLLSVPAVELRALLDEWFPFGGHLVRGLYHTARTIESTARQRSALVTLGTLAAGLAHELNNPASAATRAVDVLSDACTAMFSSLGRLADVDVSGERLAALDALRRELDPKRADPDPLARADAEETVAAWLAGHRISAEWVLARALVGAGADAAWCERVAAALPASALEPALGWVAGTLAATTALGEVKESTRRISELVSAVRSYSQMDRASLQRIDVRDGLESTLVMLGHKLRRGVTVVREYGDDVPDIEAYPGELNQVWTNLVDNAVDAMDGTGTLRVATRRDGDGAVVEIVDSGPGLPPQVAERAFEAFFTTKEVGQGTGLGLDIARRIIVERHGGRIELDPTPGSTTFRVHLPPRPAR